MQAKNTAECNMKKYLTLLLLLLLASIAVYSQSIGVTVIAAPVGANVTMNSYVWNITLANDGVTSYLNDYQGIMTVKSGSSVNYRVDFSSQNTWIREAGFFLSNSLLCLCDTADHWAYRYYWHTCHNAGLCPAYQHPEHPVQQENAYRRYPVLRWIQDHCDSRGILRVGSIYRQYEHHIYRALATIPNQP